MQFKLIPDVFVLTADPIRAERWKKYCPTAKFLNSDILDEERIKEITKKSLTKFVYVVRGEVMPANDFDFSLLPDEWSQDLLHVWNGEDSLRLMNRKDMKKDPSKYTDKVLRDGLVEIKPMEGKVYEYDYLDTLEGKAWNWYDSEEEGHINCEDSHFFVKEPDAVLLNRFNREYTPKVWDADKKHAFAQINPVTREVVEYGGVYLCPTGKPSADTKEVDIQASTVLPFDVIEVDDINDYADALKGYTSESKFVYVVDRLLDIDWDFSYYPPSYDDDVLHIWRTNFGVISVKLVPLTGGSDAIKEIAESVGLPPVFPVFSSYDEGYRHSESPFFWVVPPDTELSDDFEKEFYIAEHEHEYWWKSSEWDEKKISCFPTVDCEGEKVTHEGVFLVPNDKELQEKKHFEQVAGVLKLPDIIFLSYDEPFADQNYKKLRMRYPRAKRVNGVTGIFDAHKAAARLAETAFFFLVDADAVILDDFEIDDFALVNKGRAEDTVFVWRSRNPVNGLEYGYGGLKMFPREALLKCKAWNVDFTTSISSNFVPMPVVSNLTTFNTDEFCTWRAAFRESAKLASSVIANSDNMENKLRLMTWCTVNNDADYGEYALIGADMGKKYGSKNATDNKALEKINDFSWLREIFLKNVQQ